MLKLIILKAVYYVGQRLAFSCRPFKKPGRKACNIIYKPDAIGDFILASGAIRHLIKDKSSDWVLICSPEVYDFANFYFTDLTLIKLLGSNRNKGFNGFIKLRSIRKFCSNSSVRSLICLKHSLSGMDHVILSWLSPERSFGIPYSPINPPCPDSYRYFKFTHPIKYPLNRDAFPLEICAHKKVLETYLSTAVSNTVLSPYLDLDNDIRADEPFLLIFPSTRSRLRNYPLDKLAKALEQFVELHPDIKIVLSGSYAEKDTLEDFLKRLPQKLQAEILLPDSIIDAAKLIQKARLVLSMDSAPAHLTICLNRPGVFILSGGQFGHFAPWGFSTNQIWLFNKLPCYNCNWICIFPKPKCIEEITPYKIAEKLELALQNSNESDQSTIV